MSGIIRRIDDLGRIVIPKELRKSLRIRNGESMEIICNGNDLILKKYSQIETIKNSIQYYIDVYSSVLKVNIIVTDRNKIVGCSNNIQKKYLEKQINDFIERSIERRDSFAERQKKIFNIIESEEEYGYYSFSSIVSDSDAIGGVMLFSDNVISEVNEKQVVILAKIFGEHFNE